MLRGETSPGEKWRDTDRLLMIALERYERSIHGPCGQPLIYSTDDDARSRYERHTAVCHACAVKEKADRAAAKSDVKPTPGQLSWVAPDKALRHAMEHPLPEQYGDTTPAI